MNIMHWWQKFADFLHTANLIPLVVVVSAYHYNQALRSHDPFLVSLPIALFIDLLQCARTGHSYQRGKSLTSCRQGSCPASNLKAERRWGTRA